MVIYLLLVFLAPYFFIPACAIFPISVVPYMMIIIIMGCLCLGGDVTERFNEHFLYCFYSNTVECYSGLIKSNSPDSHEA